MSRLERLLACAVGASALAWGWSGLTSGTDGPYDEGNTLCAATRVLAGEAPYRDFWSLHAPGTTGLLAGAFRVFGTTLAVERGVKLVLVALAAMLVFLLARRAARAGWAAAAALVFIVLPTQTLSLRSRDAGLVLVLATLLAAASPSGRPRLRALAAGLLAGLTAWFKQDFLVASAFAGSIALVVSSVTDAPAGKRGRAVLGDAFVPFAVGLGAGLTLLAATLAMHGTFKEFFEQAILFPATSFGRFRSIPLGLRFGQLSEAVGREISLKGAFDAALVPGVFVAAFAAAIAGIAWGVRISRRGETAMSSLSAAVLGSSLACLLLLAAPFQRADLEHLNPALAFALVALAAVAGPLGGTSLPFLRAVAGIGALAAVALVSFAALPGARGAAFPPDLLEAARFVASKTSPGERIFVGNARHDRLAYNAPLVYFLAGRPNATRYDNLHPGVVTTRPVQGEIVRALEAARTRWIVLWDGPPAGEPNASSVSSGVTLLDEWISAHGREAARFGAFRVLEVRPPAAPPGPR